MSNQEQIIFELPDTFVRWVRVGIIFTLAASELCEMSFLSFKPFTGSQGLWNRNQAPLAWLMRPFCNILPLMLYGPGSGCPSTLHVCLQPWLCSWGLSQLATTYSLLFFAGLALAYFLKLGSGDIPSSFPYTPREPAGTNRITLQWSLWLSSSLEEQG